MALYNRNRDFSEATMNKMKVALRDETVDYREYRDFLLEYGDAFETVDLQDTLPEMDHILSELRRLNWNALQELERMEKDVCALDEAYAKQCETATEELRQYRQTVEALTAALEADDMGALGNLQMTATGMAALPGLALLRQQRAAANYQHNSQLPQPAPGQLIHGQNSVAAFLMGATTSDKGGCGWVAAYNALVLMQDYLSPADLILWFEMNNGLLLDGLLGITASSIASFFKQRGYNVQRDWTDGGDIDNMIKSCDVMILEFMWFDGTRMPPAGAHYVAIKYDSVNDEFWIYNEFKNSNSPTKQSSIYQWWANNRHMYITSTMITI